MPDTWIELASEVLPDFIKIVCPALLTAAAAFWGIRSQARSAEVALEKGNEFKAREKMFDYYRAKIEKEDENVEKASHGIGQMLGISAAEDYVDNPELALAKYFDPMFKRSLAHQPYVLNKLRGKVRKHLGSDADEIMLIDGCLQELEKMPTIVDRDTLIHSAHLLIQCHVVSAGCYTEILEGQATQALDIYTTKDA